MTSSHRNLIALGMTLALGIPSVSSNAAVQLPIKTVAAARLAAEFARLSAATDGVVGVAVKRVGGPLPAITLNAGTTFPMASTFKIAVAGTVLNRIDRGDLKLDTLVPIESSIIVPSDGIAETILHPGLSLSIHNLLELMLTRSDNTATDVLVAQAGGPAAVTNWLGKIGVIGQRVDADTAHLMYRSLDIETPGNGTFAQNTEAAFKADPSKREMDTKGLPNRSFNADVRDTSTPVAMIDLLEKIEGGKVLSPTSTKVVLEIMARCRTGEKRLKGLLPPGTAIAHKTGTLMSIANDVGLITLPDGGKLAIAVFIKGDTKGTDVEERVIADISRAAYDYYLLATGA
jgi:beta-lactamase class A